MYSLEQAFETAVEDGVLPGAVIVARNKSGESTKQPRLKTLELIPMDRNLEL